MSTHPEIADIATIQARLDAEAAALTPEQQKFLAEFPQAGLPSDLICSDEDWAMVHQLVDLNAMECSRLGDPVHRYYHYRPEPAIQRRVIALLETDNEEQQPQPLVNAKLKFNVGVHNPFEGAGEEIPFEKATPEQINQAEYIYVTVGDVDIKIKVGKLGVYVDMYSIHDPEPMPLAQTELYFDEAAKERFE